MVSAAPTAAVATYRELSDALHVILRAHSAGMS
jgi:hypothetical protein